MKIKVTKTRTEESEVELELPAYFEQDKSQYKILDETTLIEVFAGNFGYNFTNVIRDRSYKIGELFEKGTIITEEAFLSALNKVKEHTDKLVSENTPVNS